MLRAIRGWFAGNDGEAHEPAKARGERYASDAEAASRLDDAVEALRCGDTAAAESVLRALIDAHHDFAPAHALLGQLLQRVGRFEEAADSFLLAQCFDPGLAEAHYGLGSLSLEEGRYTQALDPLRQACELAPGEAKHHNALGAALLNLERVDEARSCFERAIEIDPTLAEAHSNLGYVLFRDFAEFEQGAVHIRRALDIAPGNRNALCNWTMVLQYRGDLPEAIRLCDDLLAQDPDLAGARLNRGLMLLSMARFDIGWRDYEARKQARCNYAARALDLPEWDGSPLDGRSVYVYAEQGLGDQIMFSSCLPDVLQRARCAVIECLPKLQPIMRRAFPQAMVLTQGSPDITATCRSARVECQVAMGTLPLFLRRTLPDFPRHGGYLRADPARVTYWRGRLEALPGRLKVGLSWRGGVKVTRQRLRSIPLALWEPVFQVPGVDFIDLQYFECPEEVRAVESRHGISVHRWREALDDYDETAALVGALDLVISVQTAIVHLSGALGRPVWALIPVVPEWRYLVHGESMPWYPSVKLMRQESPEAWRPMMERVARELAFLVSTIATAPL
jgi:tetratricopeptide (TPR) repeat protein